MKLKLEIEFDTFAEMVEWAEKPEFKNLSVVTKGAEKSGTEKAETEKPEKPAKVAGGLLDEMKKIGVKLSDNERYEGVQALLKSYGVTKFSQITEADQQDVITKLTKMQNADDAKYKKMLAALA